VYSLIRNWKRVLVVLLNEAAKGVTPGNAELQLGPDKQRIGNAELGLGVPGILLVCVQSLID